MSRFNSETWNGFVKSRRPTQVVCNLQNPSNYDVDAIKYLEIDVKSCRLNGIVEGNVHDIPIFCPLDEFSEPQIGIVADYSWVDLCRRIQCPLKFYIWDGPRWYDKHELEFMLETGQCKWDDIKLVFNATTHRPASDLASKLKKIKELWLKVGASTEANFWAGELAKKKDVKELLAKTALLNLLGSWGRCSNHRFHMLTTSHLEDIPWNGEVSSKPAPFSEKTETGYIFNDVTW